MKAKSIKWIAIAALILGGAALVFAQAERHGWGPGMRRHGFMRYMARYLQLTDAQKSQIKSMWQAEKPTIQPMLQQLANGRKQMLTATAEGSFDAAKVQAIANQQAQVIANLIVEKEKLQSQIYTQVLTSEQRVKFDSMQQKRTARIDHFLQRFANTSSTSNPTQ